MKRLFLVSMFVLFMSACSPANSKPLPTQPVADFPTLAPNTLPFCQGVDLETSSNSSSDQNKLVMGITLTNNSKHICLLSNPPKAGLMDQNGKALNVTTTPLAEKSSPQPALLQLAPGGIVIMTAVWQNFCESLPTPSLLLVLDLSNGQQIQSKIEGATPPACSDKNKDSEMNVGSYSFPP